eukprot:scaffold132176_cov33-Phaeocystis_antarctica.AAC.1
MASMCHPYICKLRATLRQPQALFLLMQLCDGPNVYEVLEGHGQNPHPNPNHNPHPTPHHPHPSPHPTPNQVLEGHGPFEEAAALQCA